MKFCGLLLFVTLLLCVAAALAKDDVTLLAFEVLTVLKCAATSGDQALCDRFEQCTAILTQPYLDVYQSCVVEVLGNDDIGKCTSDEELYFSEINRKKINDCIRLNAPENLSDSQEDEMDQYKDCIDKLGDDCLGDQRK
ncbi:uncharacterized protein TNIN_204431 [Trichonephila inaurata madagascariensis]|uniref:Uncharacterized protein n=1 Tax=Trichonephila inaurata madagascariensis TaxID=2747483 RepID=A0A8X6XDV4_9ARAC|nr:uncharacterized protein TNIN_204431 [Trichonephila inaurata madagascariensis]